MGKLTKNKKEALAKFEKNATYSLADAIQVVKNISFTKFDSSVDIDMRLGVDPRKDAGADYVGLDEYIEKIKGGWTDVDVVITTPNVMPKVGPLGRILGPRGLMPNPKTGTVTMEVEKAVKEVKAGKIDFKVDKTGIIHEEFIQTVLKLKPAAAKGTYVKSIFMSSTMSYGIQVDPKSVN